LRRNFSKREPKRIIQSAAKASVVSKSLLAGRFAIFLFPFKDHSAFGIHDKQIKQGLGRSLRFFVVFSFKNWFIRNIHSFAGHHAG
jgi:hypothetical protein